MLIIRLFCFAGMSTSLLVQRMMEAAKEEGTKADIKAYPINEINAHVTGIDCALLGPQVGYMKAQAKKVCDKANVPIDVIPMQDYGRCNGENVLAFAKELIGT